MSPRRTPRPSGDNASEPKPRRRGRAVAILAAIAGLLALLAVGFQFGAPGSTGAGDQIRVFESDQGQQFYQVHLPPDFDESERLPVMMSLHGCVMTGFGFNSMKDATRFNDLADEERFIVVYPTQSVFAEPLNCWNAKLPSNQLRNSGEPALLAGVARQVIEEFNADPDRIHVSGASSGAGAAVILGVTYPDVFASVTSAAGGEYGLNQIDPERPEDLTPQSTAKQAWGQMGAQARPVPLLVLQGDADEVVPPIVATRLVEQSIAVDDLAIDGMLDGDVDSTADEVVRSTPAGLYPYTHSVFEGEDGNSLVELYLVEGQGHAWSGPKGTGWFTDRSGPDYTKISWDFAVAHPMD
jgi:poly(hydroxyalkanoate) depolymerase family esterase